MAKLLCDYVIVIVMVGCIGFAEPRAVNISNIWTLPQEGFSVFYRYFRDKISWLEADAVCQFHHANLVTVDNGLQFDATRAFLKELDVISAVWIGLKRPENSARFTWTTSKTLDSSSGYWSETIPAIEQPLCAVVDPMRDFRWHALRCGGPETAAFLCELPVPTWAVDCTITSIPSLTVQYMSDSGTVQLSRDCGESGTKHISCQGKQDRDKIIEQLQCSEKENLASVLAADNSNQALLMFSVDSMTTASSTRFPLQQPILEHDILTVVSSIDQERNNKIEVNPNQIENTVKNVINKFNMHDLIRNEQTALRSEELDNVGQEAKYLHKSGCSKQYLPLYKKKLRYMTKNNKGSNWNDGNDENEDDEVMLGDHPAYHEKETQPIDIIQKAVKPTAGGDYADTVFVDNKVKMLKIERDLFAHSNASVTWTTEKTTPDSRLRRGTDPGTDEGTTIKTTEPVHVSTMFDVKIATKKTTSSPTVISSVSPVMTATEISPTIITTNRTTESNNLPTTPRIEVITGDHFIPPMLLVKARFISTRPQTESPATTILPAVSSTYIPVDSSVIDRLPVTLAISDVTFSVDREKNDPASFIESTTNERVIDKLQGNIPSVPTVAPNTNDVHQVIQVAFLTTTETSLQDTIVHASNRPKSNDNVITPIIKQFDYTTIAPDAEQVVVSSKTSSIMSPVTTVTASAEIPNHEPGVFYKSVNPTTILGEIKLNLSYDAVASKLFTKTNIETPKKDESIDNFSYLSHEHKGLQDCNDNHTYDQPESYNQKKHTELHNTFSNVDNYQPYKPNRRRIPTKPVVHNNQGAYIKKILG